MTTMPIIDMLKLKFFTTKFNKLFKVFQTVLKNQRKSLKNHLLDLPVNFGPPIIKMMAFKMIYSKNKDDNIMYLSNT